MTMELERCNLQLNSQQSADSQHSTAVAWRNKSTVINEACADVESDWFQIVF